MVRANDKQKPVSHFVQAKNFFEGKNGCTQSYVEAFYHFSEALLENKDNKSPEIIKDPEIYCYRGRCLMSQGYFIEALFDFSWSIKLEKARVEKENDK